MVFSREKNTAGFTLIELMVVVAIIGILASVIFASLNSARYKARNAQRNSDIKQLVNALNLGLAATNSLPSTGGAWACISSVCTGAYSGYTANGTVDAFLAPYIKKPTDPVDATRGLTAYLYNSSINLGGVFTQGAYLMWYVEPPITPTSCGTGTIRTNNSPLYLECAYKID